MRTSSSRHRGLWNWTPLLACLLAFPTIASGQQQQPSPAGQPNGGQSMQTGDGLLAIEANFPPEIRVGEQFTYEVQVRNASDNVALHDIKLRHRKGSGISIESVSMEGQQQDKQDKDGEKDGDKDKQDKQDKEKDKQDKQKQAQQLKSGDSLSIDQLNPGESRTIRVSASVSEEGPVDACLLISSYTPSICLQSNAVKPELQLVKTAPDQVNRCEVIELTYAVKNEGSGTIEKFEVVDELPEGLKTIEGEDKLIFEVTGGLEAGDVREFVARVYATKTGEFKSRAVAKVTDSDLKSRSQNSGPKVVGADLQVQVQGSNSVYSKQPVMFTATVTNNGDATAEDVTVNLAWPEKANLARVSDPQRKGQGNQSNQGSQQNKNRQQQSNSAVAEKDSQQQGGSNKSQPQPEKKQDSQNQQSAEQEGMTQEQITIGTLEPGQSAEFDYVIRPNGLERIETRVEAVSLCAIDAVEEEAVARAQDTASTKVVRLPALQIYAVDSTDPVELDQQVRYTVRVLNEGDMEDKQVRVTVKLPEGLKFESADGPTEHQQDNNEVRFEPVEELAAGDEIEYTVTATSQSEGAVVFQAELQSESLKSAVTAEEPTRLVSKAQSSN